MTRFPALTLVLLVAAAGRAQEPKVDPAKVLGQTKDAGSLPVWSQPGGEARQDLGRAARAAEAGVFMAGSAETGHGTAWVLSKKHRLLVTNAHVADFLHAGGGEMYAIPNGTAQLYKVERVWYHPGVRRFLQGNRLLSVRSADPKDGDVDPQSPDLAVLQLSADGPDLAVEFALAAPEELADLFARPAALFGFPGHDSGWPKLGKRVAATYHDGVVSRVTDFEFGTDSPPGERQFLQYTMATWAGFSGSPVFLPNGRVAAVHNMARTKTGPNGDVKSIPHGVRADCVLELLVHHKLDDKVPFKVDRSKVLAGRWLKPDARTAKARADWDKAVALVAQASYLVYAKDDYAQGVAKCDEALKLVPNYALAYSVRSAGVGNHRLHARDRLTDRQQLDLTTKAFEDARRAVQLDPSNVHYTLDACNALNNIGAISDDNAHERESLAIIEKLLASKNLTQDDRAWATSIRANSYSLIGDLDESWRSHNAAVSLAPDDPTIVDNRGGFLQSHGLGDHGRADLARAKELRAKLLNTGLKIVAIFEGGAAASSPLKVGDVIVSVANARVKTPDDLVGALAKARGGVEIEYVKARTGERARVALTPVDGRLGVQVEPVELK